MNILETVAGICPALDGDATSPYSVRGRVPRVVAAPQSREQAAELLRLCGSEGWAVAPWGGGTQLDLGWPPERLDLVVRTDGLNRIVDYQPEDMTLTVEAGVTLGEIAEALSQAQQELPLQVPLPRRATAGGTVAASPPGLRSAMFGGVRDWLLGCRVVGTDGLEVRGGGQVVKNVAGFDLPKLYAGSHGTLGLLTEVTFKVTPRPEAVGYSEIEFMAPQAAEAFLAMVSDSDLLPSAVLVTASGPDSLTLLLEFFHCAEAVEWQLSEVVRLAGAHGLEVVRISCDQGASRMEHLRDLPVRGDLGLRLTGVPSETARLCHQVLEWGAGLGLGVETCGLAASGEVLASVKGRPTATDLARLREIVASTSAACVFPRLPEHLGEVDPWGEAGDGLGLMRGVKQALDPAGCFNPGRFVNRL